MRRATIVVVLLQVIVLLYMAGEREYIVRYGQSVYLRTAPIDPRDIFRGDFVRLDYELSQIGAAKMAGTLKSSPPARGVKVYASLKLGADDLAELDVISNVEPESGLYLRGRTDYWASADKIDVKYGIEQLFVEQGRGLDIEKRRGSRESLQIPMEVALGVSASGTAVIKGFRWSKVGMQLAILRRPPRDISTNDGQQDEPRSPKLQLIMKNVSDEVLALVDSGDHCGFEIVSGVRQNHEYSAAYKGCSGIAPVDSDVVELAPDQEYSVEFDMSDVRWHVQSGDLVQEIGKFDNWGTYRIVYRAPDVVSVADLKANHRIWMGYLPSRAFTALGRVD